MQVTITRNALLSTRGFLVKTGCRSGCCLGRQCKSALDKHLQMYFVCVCVCLCVCMYVNSYMRVCVFLCVCLHAQIILYVLMTLCIYVYLFVCMLWSLNVKVCICPAVWRCPVRPQGLPTLGSSPGASPDCT